MIALTLPFFVNYIYRNIEVLKSVQPTHLQVDRDGNLISSTVLDWAKAAKQLQEASNPPKRKKLLKY